MRSVLVLAAIAANVVGCGQAFRKCNADTCSGCCDSTFDECKAGTSDTECGKAGKFCVRCSGSGVTCKANECTGGSGGGAGGGGGSSDACGPGTCAGCCDTSGGCWPGTSDFFCGAGGVKCRDCYSDFGGDLCNTSKQICEQCSPSNCAGCCGSTGACYAGTSDSLCGKGGTQCKACTGGLICGPSSGNCI